MSAAVKAKATACSTRRGKHKSAADPDNKGDKSIIHANETDLDLKSLIDAMRTANAIKSSVVLSKCHTKLTFGVGEQAVTMTTEMTVANFCTKIHGVSVAIMLSAFLPKCT
jgi:hypothetical protein